MINFKNTLRGLAVAAAIFAAVAPAVANTVTVNTNLDVTTI